MPILALLVHGGSRFGIERLMDDDTRLGLRKLDTPMTVVIRPPLDYPHRRELGVGRGEVEPVPPCLGDSDAT
ncbi:hypothetical protein [Brucella cytisi]|uniref:hypothetical protein n=1 Tax=Brucella cytisi TaxID=407152 RepID=UPI0035BBB902